MKKYPMGEKTWNVTFCAKNPAMKKYKWEDLRVNLAPFYVAAEADAVIAKKAETICKLKEKASDLETYVRHCSFCPEIPAGIGASMRRQLASILGRDTHASVSSDPSPK